MTANYDCCPFIHPHVYNTYMHPTTHITYTHAHREENIKIQIDSDEEEQEKNWGAKPKTKKRRKITSLVTTLQRLAPYNTYFKS